MVLGTGLAMEAGAAGGVGRALVGAGALLLMAAGAVAGAQTAAAAGQFGANVVVFDPSMPQSQIQAAVDAVAAQQVGNQFGAQRYALLFKPRDVWDGGGSLELSGGVLHGGGGAGGVAG